MITIPVPHGVGTPNVAECDGDYTMDTRRSALLWQVELQIDLIFLSCSLFKCLFLQHTLIDANNKSGSLEFSVGGNPDDFFPVTLGFNSTKSFSGIKVTSDIFLMVTIMIKSFLRFLTVWRWTGGAQ